MDPSASTHLVALGSIPIPHNINGYFNLHLNCDEKRTKVNKKRPGFAHL